MTTLTYFIIEAGQPMDGEHLTYEALMKKIPYADHDAEIVYFDAAELMRDLTTSLRICTSDAVTEWWEKHHGADEAMSWIEAGKSAPGLAMRFYGEETADYQSKVEGE